MFCRFMSLKDLNRLQQQAPDTSRPHRQSWSQPALRTRQKRRRQPYKTRLVTVKDWHPTLMNGTFEVRRTNSLSMWTKRMSKKKNIKKNYSFSLHTHTHTHTRTHHHQIHTQTHANGIGTRTTAGDESKSQHQAGHVRSQDHEIWLLFRSFEEIK